MSGGEDGPVRRFLKAARPDWKEKTLGAVEDKLLKVGIDDLPELLVALRGKVSDNLNNRLKVVGEKCFTSETLTALRKHAKEFNQATRAGGDASDSPAQDAGQTPAPNEEAKPAVNRRLGKDEMRATLQNVGLEVAANCQARELLAMLTEVHRYQEMSVAGLKAECVLRLGAAAAHHDDTNRIVMLQKLMLAQFPGSVVATSIAAEDLSSGAEGREGAGSAPAAASPPPLSLSGLFPASHEDLLAQCRAKGMAVSESETKGMLALLLKMESRREQRHQLVQEPVAVMVG